MASVDAIWMLARISLTSLRILYCAADGMLWGWRQPLRARLDHVRSTRERWRTREGGGERACTVDLRGNNCRQLQAGSQPPVTANSAT